MRGGSAAWADADGRHVWVAHDCTDGRLVTMLPNPPWQLRADHVEPSVACEACGFHEIVALGEPEPRCHDRWEFDGRRCSLMADHEGAHRDDLTMWGSYSRVSSEGGEN